MGDEHAAKEAEWRPCQARVALAPRPRQPLEFARSLGTRSGIRSALAALADWEIKPGESTMLAHVKNADFFVLVFAALGTTTAAAFLLALLTLRASVAG